MDPEDTRAILRGVFELNASLAEIADDVNEIQNGWWTTMKKKRRKRGEGLGAEFWERHRETQAILAERIAYHERRKAEERRASGDAGSQ